MSESSRVLVLGDGLIGSLVRAVILARVNARIVAAGEEPDIIWIAEDIPHNGAFTIPAVLGDYPRAEIVIMSPVPIGTTEAIAARFSGRAVTYALENFRKGDGVDDVPRPPIVVAQANALRSPLTDLALSEFFLGGAEDAGADMMAMRPREAEFTKHALNCFLATCAAYSEEMRFLARVHGLPLGAPESVMHAVRQDPRVGPRAPIMPLGKYSGHLERDVRALLDPNGRTPLLHAVAGYAASSGNVREITACQACSMLSIDHPLAGQVRHSYDRGAR